MAFSTRDRKKKRRNMRSLWIVRLNAACRLHGVTYSRLIAGLKKISITLNRRSLAELAVREPDSFKRVMDAVKGAK